MNFQKQQKPTVKVGVVDATKHYSTRTGVIHALGDRRRATTPDGGVTP